MGPRVLPTLDFETYSEAGYVLDLATGKVQGIGSQGKGGLGEVGTAAYAEHHTTEVLTLSYDLLDGRGRRRWRPGNPAPVDLLSHVTSGGPLAAWNITFEWFIWNTVCTRDHAWPPLPIEQCHCDMAKSRRYSTPGSLDKAAKFFSAARKDPAGDALIRRLTRPHTPTKKRPYARETRLTAPVEFAAISRYCDQDVVAEMDTAAHIPDLTPAERAVWLADQRINMRGVQVDTPSLDACLDILRQVTVRFTAELQRITCPTTDAARCSHATCGAIISVNSSSQYITWLASHGVLTKSIDKEHVVNLLKLDLPPAARRALGIRQSLGSASVKKLKKLAMQLSHDGRLRNQYVYCGADRTGRASAGGVQLQNITAKGPRAKTCGDCGHIAGVDMKGPCPSCAGVTWANNPDWTVEAVEAALHVIAMGDVDEVLDRWGDPVALLAGCLRGLFIAKPGSALVCCDYSAIEAVVLAQLSGCQWRIDVFNSHGKIYEMSASKITGVPLSEFEAYKLEHGAHHPLRKSLGKVAELASGYGGWVGAWKAFGADEHFDSDEAIKAQVIAWRAASPEIVEFWGGQHRQVGAKPWDSVPELFGLEGAAVSAVINPGKCYSYRDISYGVRDDVLYCRLPSGRFLHYHKPRVDPGEDVFRRPCMILTFEGHNSNSANGPIGWHRRDTYGGRLAENVTQAVAADIQMEAMVRVQASGYPVVMHTHDELTAEVPEDTDRPLERMIDLMTQRPAWAQDWPIRASGWVHRRYQKD